MFTGHLFFIFCEITVKPFAHFSVLLFVFLLLNCRSALYSLDRDHLSIMRIANIFSQRVAHLFPFFFFFC